MGKKMDARAAAVDKLACKVGEVEFTKAGAKSVGLSRREGNAIAFGILVGLAVCQGALAKDLLDDMDVEMTAAKLVHDAAEDYASFKQIPERGSIFIDSKAQ